MSLHGHLRTSSSAPNGCVFGSITDRGVRDCALDLLVPHHSLADGDEERCLDLLGFACVERELLLVRVHADRERRLEIAETAIEQVALVLDARARLRRSDPQEVRVGLASDVVVIAVAGLAADQLVQCHLTRVARQDLHAVPFDRELPRVWRGH